MIEMKILASREEWLEHRKQFLGGSDASAVIGVNGWKSNVDLFLEKTGQVIPEDISDKPNVRFGIDAEPVIRELFKLTYPKYKVEYIENNSWLNDKYPFAAVSHDGWLTEIETGRKGIWECKTTEIVSSMSKEQWAGRLPDNYYAQLIHSLMVREDCEFAHLTALLTFKFDDKEIYQQIKNYHIERNEVLEDIEYLAQEELKFWESVKTGKRPALKLPPL
jgi:putative phage-type endonuclease